MTDGEKYKLDFTFIPEESRKFNLRHILSPAARDIARRDALALFALFAARGGENNEKKR